MTQASERDAQAQAVEIVEGLQERICAAASALEHSATFAKDDWSSDKEPLRGRGTTRVLAGGDVFEKGGINTSIVPGETLPPSVVAQRPQLEGHRFFAAGVSVVMHPRNPHAPSAHCNVRYFETRAPDGTPGTWWFGGGADLTPYYPVLEDVRAFHRSLKDACDRYGDDFYASFKSWCDRYFFLPHRGEGRGVGGIFYDYLDAQRGRRDALFAFSRAVGEAFAEGYFPIVERRRTQPFGDRERSFQLMRRGRYVEFNLLYDRGTLFGLQSGGRVESILMSLPPLVRWAYDEQPELGSPESDLQPYLQPRDWFAPDPFA
jgi:coproporphyrinogen III oxidase